MHVYVYVILIITDKCFTAQVRFTSFYNIVALLIHLCQGFYNVFSPLYLFHFVAMLYQLVIVLYNYTIQFYCCQIYTASGKK